MARVIDVAQLILEARGSMSAMKLQKLVYYSQAWHLVWENEALFPEKIEAWKDGPVVRSLWQVHQGSFTVESIQGANSSDLTESESETVRAVLKAYGDLDGATLSKMTHDERPWREARGFIPDGEICSEVISTDSMKQYYGSL